MLNEAVTHPVISLCESNSFPCTVTCQVEEERRSACWLSLSSLWPYWRYTSSCWSKELTANAWSRPFTQKSNK